MAGREEASVGGTSELGGPCILFGGWLGEVAAAFWALSFALWKLRKSAELPGPSGHFLTDIPTLERAVGKAIAGSRAFLGGDVRGHSAVKTLPVNPKPVGGLPTAVWKETPASYIGRELGA